MSDFISKVQDNALKNRVLPVLYQNDSVQIQGNGEYAKVYFPQIPVQKNKPWFLVFVSFLVVLFGIIGLTLGSNFYMSLFLIIGGAAALFFSTMSIGQEKREPTNTLSMSTDVDEDVLVKVAQSHDVLGGALAHIYINGGEQAVKDALNEVDDALEDVLNFYQD